MAIQWYPGHMHKAKKAIIERLKSVDMVIEVLDARLPASSENPLLAKLSADKPKLKILNKQDLADPERTDIWLAEFQSRPHTNAIALDASDRSAAAKMIAACRKLVPHRKGIEKPLRVLICGIPNVGKSTLINGMLGKKSAKTGNEPGITKAEQRLFLADDFWLYDTPGMLWPKIALASDGLMLAASHAIGSNALIEDEVAVFLADVLLERYPQLLTARYGFKTEGMDGIAVVEGVAARRGFRQKGGDLDFEKASHIFLQDYRTGVLGRISLETPETRGVRLALHEAEMAAKAEKAAAIVAAKAADKARGKRGT